MVGEHATRAPFRCANVFEALNHQSRRQWSESEARAARLQRGDDFGDGVAEEAEAGAARELLDDPAQGELGILGHRVALVQDDELEAGGEDALRGREVHDLGAHDVDAALV